VDSRFRGNDKTLGCRAERGTDRCAKQIGARGEVDGVGGTRLGNHEATGLIVSKQLMGEFRNKQMVPINLWVEGIPLAAWDTGIVETHHIVMLDECVR